MIKTVCTAVLSLMAMSPANWVCAAPTRFAPEAISIDGRITLTPALSPDGRTAYFSQSACAVIGRCPQTLHRSDFDGRRWSRARSVPLPAQGRVDWPSVSPDGRYLYFSWSAKRARYEGLGVNEDFDLYRLNLRDPSALPEALDSADINRPRAGGIKRLRYVHNETSPVLTAAGDLYFWTERFDALGERDIYLAPGDGQGGFKTARPLPAPINSTGRDNHAWVSPGGNLMLVTYADRGGSGGDDLFVSRRSEGIWSEPQNLGPMVNSAAADFAGRLSPDGETLLFTSARSFGSPPSSVLQAWSIPTAELIELGVLTDADRSL